MLVRHLSHFFVSISRPAPSEPNSAADILLPYIPSLEHLNLEIQRTVSEQVAYVPSLLQVGHWQITLH